MYITENERRYLLENFKQMKIALSSSDLKYTNADFGSDNAESPLPLSVRLLGPSTRTIAKFSKHDTTRSSVEKLVNMYNCLFSPSTNVETFLSANVFEKDHPKKIKNDINGFLSGTYYCFYLSDNYQHEIHGGILTVFEQNGMYKCLLLMGLFNKTEFKQISKSCKREDFTDIARIRNRFNEYRKQKPDQQDYQNFSLSIGKIKVLERSALIEVHNINNPNHITILTIGTEHSKSLKQFSGGLGVFVSPATDDLHTRVGQIMLLRKVDVSESVLNQIFEENNPNREKWIQRLRIKEDDYGRLHITDEDVNKQILNEIQRLTFSMGI